MTTDYLKPGGLAVITGSQMGIGRAFAKRLARAGMRLALVDMPDPKLEDTAQALRDMGAAEVFSVGLDLGVKGSHEAMHTTVTERFGPPDLLINNAATRIGRGFDVPLGEWRRAMEVNFWAVVEAIHLFLPAMEGDGARRRILNLGSKQGITNPPGHPIYNVSKSALKTYTEALQHDLRSRDSNVSAHLVIPGWTTTGTAAHKPGAWLPEQVVDKALDDVGQDRFYVLCPDDETTPEMDAARIRWAAEDIIENRPALSRWHSDYADEVKAKLN
ncbi:SDR family NAD(P)-dependent oxidoreductase [Oceanibium sediminis]|uniref:SDR family NAD(P)-dependent oxidoreductase n=1 Tax=Oceanibium sediminis TaxID=2026339 RepID=UPI000DD35D7C|nr:SDR family NAD(P)-dependent oxidoreductase [Oceanibium sediminis]